MTLPDPLPAPPPAMADLWNLQADFSSLIAFVRRIQESARQATQAADDKVRKLQAKVQELEADNLTRTLEIRQLNQEKMELKRKLDARKPEIAAAIVSGDNMMKHFDHSLRLMKDLVLEPEVPVQTGAKNNNPRSRGNGRPTTISAPVPRHPKRITPIESDEEATVRPRSGGSAIVRTTKTTKSEPAIVKLSSSSTDLLQEFVADHPGTRAADVARGQSVSEGRKKQVSWYLEFSKRPATSEVWHGPIPYDDLAVHLVLDHSTAEDLQSMEAMTGFETRMHSVDDSKYVFMYRPVVLEGPEGTYLLSWCDDDAMVRNFKAWAKTAGDCHLFFYPTIELEQNSGWYYVGLHALSHAPVDLVWHKLSKDDKRRLCAELQDRNPDMDVGRFTKDVREGRLQQFCIEIKSKGTKAEQHEFLRQSGLLDG